MGHSDFLTRPLLREGEATPETRSPEERREAALASAPHDRSEFTRHVPVHVEYYELALQTIKAIIARADRTNRPGGLWIYGEGGSGKSFILDATLTEFPPRDTETNYVCPVLKITLEGRVVESDLLAMLLIKLGCDVRFIANQKNSELKKNLVSAIKASGVKLIVFDEAHHLWGITPTSKKIDAGMGGVIGNTVKRLYDDTGVGFVFAGIPKLKELVDKDRQLSSRWLGSLALEPFSDLVQFRGLLGSLDEAIPMREPCGLAEEVLASKILAACEGNFRALKALLAETVYLASVDNAPSISKDYLRQAYTVLFCTAQTPFDQ